MKCELAADSFSGSRIEQKSAVLGVAHVEVIVVVIEIEHSQEGTAERVEGLVSDLTESPVVLDEPENRGRIVKAVIHIVALREG